MIDGMIGALGVGLQPTHTRPLTDWAVHAWAFHELAVDEWNLEATPVTRDSSID